MGYLVKSDVFVVVLPREIHIAVNIYSNGVLIAVVGD